MFDNTIGTLDCVPLAIRSYFVENVQQEATEEFTTAVEVVEDFEGNSFEQEVQSPIYEDVTYLTLTDFGEAVDKVDLVLLNNKPLAVVNRFLTLANNLIDKTFYENYITWLEKEPVKEDYTEEENTISDEDINLTPKPDFNEDHTTWLEKEPKKETYKTLEDYSNYSNWCKFTGIEFNGVMCSATKADFWGLSSAEAWIRAGNTSRWEFDNGNVLELTLDNIDDFYETWLPFRLSFFK